MKHWLKAYADFTKIGISIFVVLSALFGFALAFTLDRDFSALEFFLLILGLFLLSGGSLGLNQIQDLDIDQLMPRTQKRPLVSEQFTITTAYIIASSHLVLGILLLAKISILCAALGLLTVFLYNGVYTLFLKRKMAFGAVPGAVPGALPVTVGYAAGGGDIFSPESVYIFLILFFWQMPHFWALSLKYKEDYAKGGVPVLPVAIGVPSTLRQIAIYTLLYVLIALLSPLWVIAGLAYTVLVLPTCAILSWEAYRYLTGDRAKSFLRFFLWINVSMLVFVVSPVVDKWIFLLGWLR